MANDYWVTFRIEHDAKYDERYNAFDEAVRKYGGGLWASPTSFYLVESDLGIDAFTKSITKPLNKKTDIVLVRYISKDAARVFGDKANFEVIESFMPGLKKLP